MKKFFLKWIYFVHYFNVFKKSFFKKNIGFSFSTLAHDLYIFDTCYNYVLCSLDPGESISNNYSIIWVTKNILTHEKHIFSVLSKSNVDEARFKTFWNRVFRSKMTRCFFEFTKKNPGLWESGHNCFRNRNFKTFGTFCTFSEVFWTNRWDFTVDWPPPLKPYFRGEGKWVLSPF